MPLDKKEKKEFIVVLSLFAFFTLTTIFLFIKQIEPTLVGQVVSSMSLMIKNSPPVITAEGDSYLVGELINHSDCGFDPNGAPVTCSYSQPLNSTGMWQTGSEDMGTYEVQINATDGELNSTKNITILVTTASGLNCSLNITRHTDNVSVNLSWSFPASGFTNYTVYWIDNYITQEGFNTSKAYNKTFNSQTYFLDSNASSAKQRYYKVKGFNEFTSLTCNATVGKFTWEITNQNGKWNYLSTPFYLKENHVTDVFDPVIVTASEGDKSDSEVEVVYWYNASTGGFKTYLFTLGMGDLEYVYPGESYIIKPKTSKQNLTIAGDLFSRLERNITTANGRWNYVGWVAERTDLQDAHDSIKSDYDVMYWYNSSSGGFLTYLNLIPLGDLDELYSGEVYWVKPTVDDTTWTYDMYNNP